MMGNYACPSTLSALAGGMLGVQTRSWLEQALQARDVPGQAVRARVVIAGSRDAVARQSDSFADSVPPWQRAREVGDEERLYEVSADDGPILIVDCALPRRRPQGMLRPDSDYARGRDAMGLLYARLRQIRAGYLRLEFDDADKTLAIGCLVGLELAAYDYRASRGDTDEDAWLPVLETDIEPGWINEAVATGHAVNSARHLVNLPAADLDPRSYSELLDRLFHGSDLTHVTVWSRERLEAGNMGLMLAVGKAAEHAPRLVHIRYRHPDCDTGPVALVGKGITFDTGGLDLKPSNFMRNMKKDMGGSAALAGVAVWLERARPVLAVDIYLAIAENAVGQQAFRPGDILTARNGKTVEIDNTDAEGRLVLADALSVAVSSEDKPAVVIDVATLTGAARVALGLKVGALFATDDALSEALLRAGMDAGDLLWRLPLVAAYDSELRSPVAALVNSSTSRYGGAITAAMFLAEFVDEVPWAHIDINAWNESDDGPVKGPGGNGQAVQCLIEYLRRAAGQ